MGSAALVLGSILIAASVRFASVVFVQNASVWNAGNGKIDTAFNFLVCYNKETE